MKLTTDRFTAIDLIDVIDDRLEWLKGAPERDPEYADSYADEAERLQNLRHQVAQQLWPDTVKREVHG
jgi:hypothetical protein